jgi:hypothetical protein
LASRKPYPMKVSDFAEKLGISRIHLGRLMRADGNFNSSLFTKIEEITAGDLKAVDLFAHYQQQQVQRASNTVGAD